MFSVNRFPCDIKKSIFLKINYLTLHLLDVSIDLFLTKELYLLKIIVLYETITITYVFVEK